METFQTLTRCPSCLGLTYDRTEGCIDHHPEVAHDRARRLLHNRNYIIQEGIVKFVTNDDPDNYGMTHIAEGSDPLEVWTYLEQAGFPQSSDWPCPSCGDSLVSEIGGICRFCAIANDQAERAGV